MDQTTVYLPLAIAAKSIESNRRLPCMSSFVLLKRQRLNPSAKSSFENLQNTTAYIDNNTVDDNNPRATKPFPCDIMEDQQQALRCNMNSNPDVARSYSAYSGQALNENIGVEETRNFYSEEVLNRPCHQLENGSVSPWVALRGDNYNSVQNDMLNFKIAEMSDEEMHYDSQRNINCEVQRENYIDETYVYSTSDYEFNNDPEKCETQPYYTNYDNPRIQTSSAFISYEYSSSPTGYLTSFETDESMYNTYGECNAKSVHDPRNAGNNEYNLLCYMQEKQSGINLYNHSPLDNGVTGVLAANTEIRYPSSAELSPVDGTHQETHYASRDEMFTTGYDDIISDSRWSQVGLPHTEILFNNEDANDNASKMASTACMNNSPIFVTREDIKDPKDVLKTCGDNMSSDVCKANGKKTDLSYIALISKAILSSPEKRMLLSDIYDYLSQNYKAIESNQKAWRNSVRHNLSLNECFVKQERIGRGRGHYWSIHPACVDDFIKGDFRRRRARRRAKQRFLGSDDSSVMTGGTLIDCST